MRQLATTGWDLSSPIRLRRPICSWSVRRRMMKCDRTGLRKFDQFSTCKATCFRVIESLLSHVSLVVISSQESATCGVFWKGHHNEEITNFRHGLFVMLYVTCWSSSWTLVPYLHGDHWDFFTRILCQNNLGILQESKLGCSSWASCVRV